MRNDIKILRDSWGNEFYELMGGKVVLSWEENTLGEMFKVYCCHILRLFGKTFDWSVRTETTSISLRFSLPWEWGNSKLAQTFLQWGAAKRGVTDHLTLGIHSFLCSCFKSPAMVPHTMENREYIFLLQSSCLKVNSLETLLPGEVFN